MGCKETIQTSSSTQILNSESLGIYLFYQTNLSLVSRKEMKTQTHKHMIKSRKFVLLNAFFDDHVLLGGNNYLKNVRPDVTWIKRRNEIYK